MKKTHLSVGLYDRSYLRSIPGTRVRQKHSTACGTVCDNTKATTDPAKVTCAFCKRKAVRS